jgi:type III pantothenate kinase
LATAAWRVASVHRGAAEQLAAAVANGARQTGRDWPVRFLTNHDVPLVIDLDAPDRLGIDRVLAAHAANHVRDPRRAAVVVDMGTAITIDLVAADGSFVGGAILPGMDLAARALAEHTDALPRVTLEGLTAPPAAVAKAAVPAIESGLFWGAVGAIRELVARYAVDLAAPPDVFLTGGGAPLVAQALAGSKFQVRFIPHLVIAGIALLDQDVDAS